MSGRVTSLFFLLLRSWWLVGAGCMVLLASCAGPSQLQQREPLTQDGVPVFKVEKYFSGSTQSWGVFEDRSGAPTRVIETRTTGRMLGGVLQFEQDILIQGKEATHRSWLIRPLGGGRYEATGTGIVGTAKGEASGNVLHLSFTMDALPGNPLGRVQMSQWLYLQGDGLTVINRATVKKGGVIIAQITEHFRKDGDGELMSAGPQHFARAETRAKTRLEATAARLGEGQGAQGLAFQRVSLGRPLGTTGLAGKKRALIGFDTGQSHEALENTELSFFLRSDALSIPHSDFARGGKADGCF